MIVLLIENDCNYSFIITSNNDLRASVFSSGLMGIFRDSLIDNAIICFLDSVHSGSVYY